MEHTIKKRNQYSAEFKAKVALLALSNTQTVAEIAATYKIHPLQVTKWKTELQKNAPGLFVDKRKKHEEEKDKLIDELYRQIGQHKVEVDWLKKKVGF